MPDHINLKFKPNLVTCSHQKINTNKIQLYNEKEFYINLHQHQQNNPMLFCVFKNKVCY